MALSLSMELQPNVPIQRFQLLALHQHGKSLQHRHQKVELQHQPLLRLNNIFLENYHKLKQKQLLFNAVHLENYLNYIYNK